MRKYSSKQALLIFLKVFVGFFSGHFSKFSRKTFMEIFFFRWTAYSFTKEGLPHRRFVPEHSIIFSDKLFLKAPLHCCWNVLQSFSHFDNSSKWIVSEAAIQRCSLKLVGLGPRKRTYSFSKIRDSKIVENESIFS